MPDITITLTLPEDGPATVLMQRGELAVTHTYTGGSPGSHNDRRALERAYDKLTTLESNPPDIPDPPKPKSKAKTKRKSKADAEPTVEIPLAKETRTVPMSRVKLTGGETDAAAHRQALTLAGRLIDGGLWDGERSLHIPDVSTLARKMKPYQTKELTLFTLEELLGTTDAAQPKLIPMPTATEENDNVEPAVKAGNGIELAPGVTVTWADDMTDTDGDPIPFTTGRIVEINGDATWVESLDGDCDTWVATAHLTIPHS